MKKIVDRADNVYLIDTKMFNFDGYCAAYLIKGQSLALIDTGLPNQLEVVKAGIKAHGFSVGDISYIFITHAHTDHCGNSAPLLNECPAAKVYVHPAGKNRLIDPGTDLANLKGVISPHMLARFGVMEPVPPSRVQYLKDGDVFDLGNGEKLKVFFTPGHQPSGVTILAEKNRGLFINDLVGLNLPEGDFSMILNPPGSDVVLAMESLRKLANLPADCLYMGHYGVSENPSKIIQRALNNLQHLMDIGAQWVAAGKSEKIGPAITAVKIREVAKLLPTRGKAMYDYLVEELIPPQSKYFSEYYLKLKPHK